MRGAARRGEDGVVNAAVDETGSAIERQRMQVGCRLQAFRTPRPQNLRDAVDERGGDPAASPAWINEQVFQFEDAAGLDPGGEANQRPFFFRDIRVPPASPSGPKTRYSGWASRLSRSPALDSDALR